MGGGGKDRKKVNEKPEFYGTQYRGVLTPMANFAFSLPAVSLNKYVGDR